MAIAPWASRSQKRGTRVSATPPFPRFAFRVLREQAYKPGSVTGPLTLPSPPHGGKENEESPDGDHLSGTPVTRRLMQPTRGCGGPPPLPPCGPAPGGVCPGLPSPGASCALTARLHPYPEPLATLGYRATPCT